MGLLDAIEKEEARRDALIEGIRRAILASYSVGGDTRLCVLRSEVHAEVADALDRPNVTSPMAAAIRRVICGMGAVVAQVKSGARVYLAVRRLTQSAKDAEDHARRLRGPFISKRGKRVARDTQRVNADCDWEAILAEEGMPMELPMLKRGGSLERVDGGKREGVYRQPATAHAEIYQGDNDRVTDMLAAVEQERRVLKLRAQGLSVRGIAVAMGVDKMAVQRTLKRLEARLQGGKDR